MRAEAENTESVEERSSGKQEEERSGEIAVPSAAEAGIDEAGSPHPCQHNRPDHTLVAVDERGDDQDRRGDAPNKEGADAASKIVPMITARIFYWKMYLE